MARKKNQALLILDMLNTFDFPEGKKLLSHSQKVARNILKLRERCRQKKIPIIYLNDNFGKWQSNWKDIFNRCVHETCLGREIAYSLQPHPDDYFVLKPKHSGFYSTTLDVLLEDLKVESLILTGIAGNICVLFTANDAHMREYEVIVPKDCIASNTIKDNNYVLDQFESVFGFKTTASTSLRLA